MKNISKFLVLLFVSLSMVGCLVDDEAVSDSYGDGPNFVGFDAPAATASLPATGDITIYNVKIKASGPTYMDMTAPITVNVAVDAAASTAVEGVNYLPLETTSVTLTAENNYQALLPVRIVTAGINPPLDESPVLVLDIEGISGGSDVVVSGITESVSVKIDYLCFSDLSGVYIINYSSGPMPHTVTEISPGLYQCDFFPAWPTDPTTAFTFSDVCGQLTMIDWGYSNVITGTGHVEESTGNIIWDSVTVEGVSGYENLSWTMIKQP
ncbi:MAG TPA: hypothetical protein VFM82_12525 [Flavobacteriaceae bacterium]|nr:hypothetical protein [Flavobacteriaceae bacterium]